MSIQSGRWHQVHVARQPECNPTGRYGSSAHNVNRPSATVHSARAGPATGCRCWSETACRLTSRGAHGNTGHGSGWQETTVVATPIPHQRVHVNVVPRQTSLDRLYPTRPAYTLIKHSLVQWLALLRLRDAGQGIGRRMVRAGDCDVAKTQNAYQALVTVKHGHAA